MDKTAHQLEKKYSRLTIKKACDFFEACGKHCTIDELFLKCEEIEKTKAPEEIT